MLVPNRCRWFGLALVIVAAVPRAEVEITGLTEAQEFNVRAYLGIDTLDCEAARWLVSWEYLSVDEDVATALEALGYYSSELTKALAFEQPCWRATLHIMPGEPVMVATVTLDVDAPLASEPSFIESEVELHALLGEPLNHESYESAKRAIRLAAVLPIA